MLPRTLFLSRLIGLYCVFCGLSMLTHKEASIETVMALNHNAPLMFVVGILAMAAGLAMVLSHNIWTGGALPVIVTLVGWIILVKGLLILFLSSEAAVEFFLGTLQYKNFFYVYSAISILFGGYLTYMGFKSAAR